MQRGSISECFRPLLKCNGSDHRDLWYFFPFIPKEIDHIMLMFKQSNSIFLHFLQENSFQLYLRWWDWVSWKPKKYLQLDSINLSWMYMIQKRADITKGDLLMRCKPATWIQWVNFLTASKTVKILRDQLPTCLYDGLIENWHMKHRKPGLAFFFNSAKKKAGEQSLQNCLSMMKDVTIPWHMNNLNSEKIRIEMKKTINLRPLSDKWFNLIYTS